MERAKKLGTEKLDEVVTVKLAGYGCQGCVSWESRYYYFTLADGREVKWHGGNAEYHYFERGQRVHLRATIALWATGNGGVMRTLQRVKVQE